MCLVIVNVDGRHVPRNYIRSAFNRNGDSFGVMWSNDEGELKFAKGIMTLEVINRLFDRLELEGRPYVAHFRMATHGATNYDNAHPFIVSKDEFGGVGMVHNGVMSEFSEYTYGFGRRDGKSDTANFVDRIQDHISANDFETADLFAREAPCLRKEYESELYGNKLVFMNGAGEINIVNERSGCWVGGCWYSNTYSIGSLEKYHRQYSGIEALHDPDRLRNLLEEANDLFYDHQESSATSASKDEEDDDIFFGTEEDALSAAFQNLDQNEIDDEIIMHPLASANGYRESEELSTDDLIAEVDRVFGELYDEDEDTLPGFSDGLKTEIDNILAKHEAKRQEEKLAAEKAEEANASMSEWEKWVREYNDCISGTGELSQPVTTPIKPSTTSTNVSTTTSSSHIGKYYESFQGKYQYQGRYQYEPKTWEDDIVEAFLQP